MMRTSSDSEIKKIAMGVLDNSTNNCLCLKQKYVVGFGHILVTILLFDDEIRDQTRCNLNFVCL